MKRNRVVTVGLALAILCSVIVGAGSAMGQSQESADAGRIKTSSQVGMTNTTQGAQPGAESGNPADGLSVHLALEKRLFTANEPILLHITLTNTTSSTLHVLTWGTPLEGFKKDMFAVTQQGARIRYTGMLVKRGQPGRDAYVAIGAGQTLSAAVNLAAGYAIQQVGEYSVELKTGLPDVRRDLSGIGVQGAAGQAASPNAMSITAPALSFVLTGNRTSAPNAQLKAATFTNCSTPEQQAIGTAFLAAQGYANNSVSVLQNASAPASAPRYTTWFGTHTPARYTLVTTHFSNIKNAFDTQGLNGFEWVCNPIDCGSGGVYAYVYPDIPYRIHLCSGFWAAPNTGTDSRAGTLIHEASHFTILGGTDDFAYGQTNAKNLAINNPNQAVMNADNHEYFAENTPPLAMPQLPTATATSSVPTATPGELDKFVYLPIILQEDAPVSRSAAPSVTPTATPAAP